MGKVDERTTPVGMASHPVEITFNMATSSESFGQHLEA